MCVDLDCSKCVCVCVDLDCRKCVCVTTVYLCATRVTRFGRDLVVYSEEMLTRAVVDSARFLLLVFL